MIIGMLWYDDDKQRDLAQKVARAADYYRAKYGAAPNVCFVHPTHLPSGLETAAGVQIRPERTVMPHHLWLGVSEAPVALGSETSGRKQ